jgi:hypothetical protein
MQTILPIFFFAPFQGKYLVHIKDEFEKVAPTKEAFAKFVDSLPFRMHVDDTPKAAVDFVALVSQYVIPAH